MLVIEQLILPHSQRGAHPDIVLQHVKGIPATIEFDADTEQGELERNGGPHAGSIAADRDVPIFHAPHDAADTANGAFPLTFGLVIHGLADGLALGVSSLPTAPGGSLKLSFIIFLALLVHKGQRAAPSQGLVNLLTSLSHNSAHVLCTDYVLTIDLSFPLKVQKASGSLQCLNPS